jgi:hypothetical protein
MDPVSIALGVAPLCVAALKGARKLKAKVGQLGSNGADVKRYRKRLETQRTLFLGDCELLLRESGLETTLAAEMIRDSDHEHWNSKALEESLQLHLGDRYDAVRGSSEDVGSEIEELDQALVELEVDFPGCGKVSVSSPPGIPVSSPDQFAATAHKARISSRVERSRERLNNGIENLERSIAQFRSLRELAKKLREPDKGALLSRTDVPPPRTATQKARLSQFILVAQHASSFLQLLSESWTCLKSTSHSKHTIKLLLDAVVSGSNSSVTLRIVLNYEALEGAMNHQYVTFPLSATRLPWYAD